ncbi:hypothetical protein, variant [Sphaeroforma arctica JP610]|uniref:Uncharacterized protein n=1 Tax=Sphaeroforma arctica JP610 TaxID=667725 RepID=A0A0L0FRP6_9EUKA|nr:hypothetical protein, variant [Sphaeroforma arctica JP610]KNC79497.1 hypothetical protein, variant [Sphaeroforma arctica JP610]|eukprot:XP_014153399.1 hypothetical protein, variant [Sphaeroforma arctica JP610]
MEDTFILSVLGACIFAAVVAVCATYGVERMGGLLGGIFETTPTTIIPAAIGIARSVSDTKELSKAMSSVPVGLLVTSTFLMVWKYLPPRLDERISSNKGLAITISASLITWLIFALFSVFSLQDVSQDRMLVVGYCSVAALLLIGFSATFYTFERNHALPNPKTDMPEEKTPVKTLIVRGCFAGVATAVTVLLSKVNEVAAGVFSTFPSIFLTTMVSLWLSKGAKLASGTIRTCMYDC